MSSSLKPIEIWGLPSTPNPFKVLIILEELKLPYTLHPIPWTQTKEEPYLTLNPNGRVPTIEDPNTGLKLWESGAIVEYLIQTYDKDKSLQYTSFPEKHHQSQWSYFQTSGQGPYFGQLGWFALFHPEKNLTSAIDRYKAEVRRVIGVIDLHLTKTGQEYLIGEKISYADLMFVPWNELAPKMMDEGFLQEWEKTWPKSWTWHQKMMQREAVKKAAALKEEKV